MNLDLTFGFLPSIVDGIFCFEGRKFSNKKFLPIFDGTLKEQFHSPSPRLLVSE